MLRLSSSWVDVTVVVRSRSEASTSKVSTFGLNSDFCEMIFGNIFLRKKALKNFPWRNEIKKLTRISEKWDSRLGRQFSIDWQLATVAFALPVFAHDACQLSKRTFYCDETSKKSSKFCSENKLQNKTAEKLNFYVEVTF